MTLADRKSAELSEKLTSFYRELAAWRAESEGDRPLEKHHTQVRAVAVMLETFANGLRQRLEDAKDTSAVLARAPAIEMAILELYRIWEFFRGKFALRFVPWYLQYLLAADEFAWSCYQPIQRWIQGGIGREPPLVFLNGGSSPFTLPRGFAYSAEDVPGEELRNERLRAALHDLPIPVIGVPWFQLHYLPDATVIGHEVGHDVETDLALAPRVRLLLERAFDADGVDPARQEAWHAWRGEVFADVYGALATGPAYVSTLLDFLAGDPVAVASEVPRPPDWGSYPPPALRVLLCAEVAAHRGLEQPAADLRARWREAYPRAALEGFETDVKTVVRAIVDGPYCELGNAGLTTLIDFAGRQHELAVNSAGDVLAGFVPRAADVRVLIAAARLAFDQSPSAYGERDVARRVLEKIKTTRGKGTRAVQDDVEAGPSENERDARDQIAGRRLLELFASHGDGPSPSPVCHV